MENKNLTLKIITYTGKSYLLEFPETDTVKDLIIRIQQEHGDLPDINLIHKGKVLKDFDRKIGSITQEHTTFYLNPSAVHGGCMPKDHY